MRMVPAVGFGEHVSRGRAADQVVVWTGVISLLVLLADPLSAQTITGTLLDGGTGAPIPAGVITLLTEPGEVATRVEADSAGAFSIAAPQPGSYYLRAERIGYRAVTEGIFDLGEGGSIEVQINLLTQPVELEGVEATVTAERAIERRQREYLEGQGFYDRKKMGFGSFIEVDSLPQEPFRPSDLLRSVPGLDMIPPFTGIVRVDGDCVFSAWVNGIKVFQGREWDMGSTIQISDIAAIEVFTRASNIPLQYGGLSGCAVILVWTR